MKILCPICDGSGRVFVGTAVAAKSDKAESSCYCWVCRGTGKAVFHSDTEGDKDNKKD